MKIVTKLKEYEYIADELWCELTTELEGDGLEPLHPSYELRGVSLDAIDLLCSKAPAVSKRRVLTRVASADMYLVLKHHMSGNIHLPVTVFKAVKKTHPRVWNKLDALEEL